MVVVPTSNHVVLTYGTSHADIAGYAASGIGLGLLVTFRVMGPVNYENLRRRKRRRGAHSRGYAGAGLAATSEGDAEPGANDTQTLPAVGMDTEQFERIMPEGDLSSIGTTPTDENGKPQSEHPTAEDAKHEPDGPADGIAGRVRALRLEGAKPSESAESIDLATEAEAAGATESDDKPAEDHKLDTAAESDKEDKPAEDHKLDTAADSDKEDKPAKAAKPVSEPGAEKTTKAAKRAKKDDEAGDSPGEAS
jgi:hypothetical protein